jgi:hypothetical protein
MRLGILLALAEKFGSRRKIREKDQGNNPYCHGEGSKNEEDIHPCPVILEENRKLTKDSLIGYAVGHITTGLPRWMYVMPNRIANKTIFG